MNTVTRILLALSVLATLGIGLSAQGDYAEGTEISLLQWSHFVPRYDEWFDAYAAEWGEANGVGVSVDHVNFTELFSTLAAEIDAGDGHTIVEVLFSPAAFIDGLHDLGDINAAAAEAHGERASTCQAASYLPVVDTYYAYTHGYVPDPGDYDIALWTEAGYPGGAQDLGRSARRRTRHLRIERHPRRHRHEPRARQPHGQPRRDLELWRQRAGRGRKRRAQQ